MTISRHQVMEPEPAAPRRAFTLPPVPRGIPFSLSFIAVCVAIAAADFLKLGGERSLLEVGALHGPSVRDGELWRVLSTAVLHAGALHLVMNMMAVHSLGGMLERAIGWWRLLLITVITAFGAATLVLLFSYDRVTVGASGVICGWLGAMLPLATAEGRRFLMNIVVQIAIISLIPFVSWQGHLGGFLAGIAAGAALRYTGKRFPLAAAALIITFAFTTVAALDLHAPAGAP